MRKAYLFIYSDATGGRDAIRAWANNEPAVLHWRFDMPHSFYIISEQEASELAASFTNFNGKKGRFLIVEAGENRQGLLPKETWYLLRHKKQKPKNV
jgi:hypothetical protein